MTDVEEYIYNHEDDQRQVMLFFHDWLSKELNLTEKIRFGLPFYYGKSWICYLNPTKKGNVEFAFIRGNELSNKNGILENKGRKQVYSIEFQRVKEIDRETIGEIIHEAILLDDTKPYKAKNYKK